MNVGNDSINVYAEAKSEYTRQLCQILGSCIQIFFLDLLAAAKEKDADPKRLLWNFQTLLQEIPDWNQDKVIRETDKIKTNSNCDYLEELLTAVFIAHTKVLSAIRITTKQKKLQITIPKLDHFLHRTLRETGRMLWGNAFLFAEQGNGIERQKNMRQVEGLIQEGIQQSIRSLLPVKSILKEYLNDDGEEDDEEEAPVEEKPTVKEEPIAEPSVQESSVQESPVQESSVQEPVVTKEAAPAEEPVVTAATPPTFFVDTERSVGFTNMDTYFDSNNPDENSISAPVEHVEEEEVDHITQLDHPPEPMDGFEDLEEGKIEFEELA
jgi:hypothetical protein